MVDVEYFKVSPLFASPGWYFMVRAGRTEGHAQGPFPNRQLAERAAESTLRKSALSEQRPD